LFVFINYYIYALLTTRLVASHLWPINPIWTEGSARSLTAEIHYLTLSNEDLLVTSNTINAPTAPR